jgi:hypothetical protein
MLGGLGLSLRLDYSWGLGEVSCDLFVSEMVQVQPVTVTTFPLYFI